MILGWPIDPYGGTNNEECRRVMRLLEALQAAQTHLPTVLWDERGSSAAARAAIKGDRLRAPPEHAWKVDMLAAEGILTSFQEAALPAYRELQAKRAK